MLRLYLLILLSVPGVYCNWEVLYPNRAKSVSGSCALFPCSFNYPSNVQAVDGLIKMWYKDYDGDRKLVYHPTDQVDAAFLNRVEFVGEPETKNCTILISNVQTSDSGTFYFRFEIVNVNKWLDKTGVKLEVTDYLLAPDVVFPSEITEGESVTFQCSTQYFCPDGSVSLEWTDHPSERSHQSYTVQMDTSAILFTRNLTTSFSWTDDQKNIYCAVSTGNKKARKEITLNVVHPPKGVKTLLQPSSGNIKEGDSVTLTCNVNSSNPSVTNYTWYKGGLQVSTERVIIFHRVSRSDSGEYRCQAQNSLGRASSDNTVRLVVFSARIIVSPSQDIGEGEAVTMTCEVPGARPDEVHYSWSKNNIWIKESSVTSLSFPRVTINDAGYYYCRVQNDKGSDDSPPVILNVKYPPRVPSLSSFLETQQGNLAIIHCTVESNPFSELTVYKDGQLIGNSSSHGTLSERVQVTSTGNSLRMRIQDVTLSDEGLYSCNARNEIGNSSTSLQFIVETAKVIITPSSETEEGKEVTLICRATRGSESETTYSWYKNSKRLKEDMRVKELVLRRLSKMDAGSYFCKAHSSQGTSTSPPVTLHVLFPPRDLSLNSLVSSQGILQAVIQCTVDSDPPSQMFLYQDGTLVASSTRVISNKRYEVSHSTNSLQLEIRSVVLEDEGQYVCLVNNSYGEMTGALEFTTETAKIIAFPSGDVREGSGVNLTCSLKTMSDNRNYSYSWYKNSLLHMEGSSSLLEIPKVSSSDSGFYYCRAWNNESSKSSAVISLNVAYAPRNLQVISFQDTAEGKSAFIRCTVDSFPSAEMSFYREDQLVASNGFVVNERYRVTSSHNELTMNINNLKIEDEGKYNCTSRNNIGSASQSMVFHVQTARVLVSPSTEVLESSQVTMTCSFMKLQLEQSEKIWYKNSKWLKKTRENTLVFDHVKDSDTGYYHCVVQETEDSSVSPSVFLHVTYGPRTPVMSSFWEAQSGQTGIIQCSVDSDPPSSLALYFRGMEIWSSDSMPSPNDRIRVSSSQNMVKMEISEVRLEDEGTYLCAAKNRIGESRMTVNFTALTTRIVISPSSEVQEGEAVNMTCVVATEVSGAILYTWYKNGVTYSEGSANTLQFTKVMSEDRGAFHCSVQSHHGTKSSQSVVLNVLYPPKNVVIKSFVDTEQNKAAIILGSADSNPPSNLSLYKDGQLMVSTNSRWSNERTHAYFSPGLLRLEITNVKSSDQGSYVLVAENILGTNQASAIFNVEDVRVIVSPSIELREGNIVTITCEVLDNSQEINSYTWHKNSRWFQEVKVRSIGLGRVSSSDAGSYSCTAHTTMGSKTSAPVSLSVLYPPRNLSLTSLLELQGRQLGVILCTVDSNPPSQMHFLKDKEPLDSSNSTQWFQLYSSHNTLKLEIRDITTKDQGEYTCHAQNSLGTLERSIKFTAQSARLMVVPSEEIYEGRSVTLTCEAPNMDNTTYTWYKNNKWLHEGPERTYVLLNVSSSETGSYHCLANHWKGNRASPLVGISVLYRPKNLVISSFLESHERKRGIILCSVDSHPPSTMGIYRNNLLLGSSEIRQADRGHKYWASTSYNYLRLEIRDIGAEDGGNYVCTAKNTLGTASSSIDIDIRDFESLVYKVITFVAIICIVFLVSTIIVLLYRKKKNEHSYIWSTDQEPIEMENKETSQDIQGCDAGKDNTQDWETSHGETSRFGTFFQ
ncbi:sialoadhesin-like [Dendropsophus ebraccatus]|uniref:sialoadhesin-like n=1 Tax=Dendropsophus ebraccatus TaxID=150705 RepID=UPI00383126F7